ncbi:hypothetical protein HMPREF3164_04920 [Rothia sp. HMSC08A08]|jgi:hypothetical protein|uniref:hypothetical protein n=1 Tax=Rothia TaxID=32207 RepID=UPI0008A117B5|nr:MULTISPECIES: hypothetical protein [Rothia]OFS80823.1 hypothetical protein HMPREF3164_04920 [Rothia sp. HMSC08A08]
MILNIALVLAVTQMLSCVLIIKGHRNWNYLCYKFPYRGTKDGFSGFISKVVLVLCGIITLISILLVKYDPNFKNAPVWFLFLVSGGWYISLALYLDRKNFYLQTTTEGISWGNLLSISYDASYEDITKFSYETRGIYGLTWLVVKTNHGKTLRFDPLLTGSGSLIPQLAFRVENGYWAKSADPEDQQLLQNFIDKPEKARELLMSWSPCVIER